MFIRTTAINKILALKKRIKGIQGGTSAGKTYGEIPIEIDYAIAHPRTETSIVAESIPHLKRGALKDFKNIMLDTERWRDSCFNKTDLKYTFPNGSYIEFFSSDDASKLRGGRRDRLYMNEANNMTLESYTQLSSRTKGSVTLDWNPTSEFWFHTELMGDDDVDYITLTYRDNEACPQSAIDFILKAKEKAKTSSYWDNWYKVYGLGQIGSLEGVIFKDWKTIDSLPEDAKYIGSGLDWGFSKDPTAATDFYRWNGQVIWDEALYQKGLTNAQIYNHLKEFKRSTVADSAEPKSIYELRSYGMDVVAADKGRDSIDYGISLIQQEPFLVTSRSTNVIKELRNYCWDTDKQGEQTGKPIDNWNHAIDGARYFYMKRLSNQRNQSNSGAYASRL